jgi:hypothetical protein
MSALTDFVENENRYRLILKRPLLSLAIAADRQTIANEIDSALSPENLSCDGELSYAETNRRYRKLTTAAKQLLQVDPSIRFYEYA